MLITDSVQMQSKRSRKGLYEIIEEVLLFSVGIVLMIGMISLFTGVEKNMLETLGEARLDAANKYVASTAIALHATNCTRCYATIALPPIIGGEKFIIGGSPQKKTLIYAQGKYLLQENITVPADGQADSSYRSVQVEYKSSAGTIKIYGASYY